MGISMFSNCTELKKFVGDLSSLESGKNMFSGCKLDSESLSIIIDTIQKLGYSDKDEITIGLDCLYSKKDDFAKEIGFDTMDEIIAYLDEKGWVATIEYNG
jgi:enolase